MKKIFTFMVAAMMATNMMAQMHGALTFAGASHLNVATVNIDNESDTVKFVMNGMDNGDITLPKMQGNMMGNTMTIPSFTIKAAKFAMGANHVVTFEDQTFTATAEDGKTVNGSSFSGTYNMADNSLTLTTVFKYGMMPLSMTYTIKSYYVKAVSNSINVNVGGAFDYKNENVTYKVRKYKDGDVEKVDVEVPSYTLDNTVMGNLTLGTYIVKGLTYDAEKGGYYRDYKNDGLKFHFKAEGGSVNYDQDFEFNATKDNNILVVYDGSNISSIVNTFQMGAMPFPIKSTFGNGTTNGVEKVEVKNDVKAGDGKMYNLRGQRVDDSYKGIVIMNGKKFLKK